MSRGDSRILARDELDTRLRSHEPAPPPSTEAWFAELARWMLHDLELVIGDAPCRMLAVEAYLWAPWHRDPFAHRHVTQASSNTWYFHRTGRGYCGGTYKGLDLTFGHHAVFGGLLVRAVELADGRVLEGPSLLVDHVLAQVGARHVFELHTRLIARLASDPDSPLHLRRCERPRRDPIHSSARVGLTLLRAAKHPEMPAWWLRRYRYTTTPSLLRKPRLHQVAALAADGLDAAQIARSSGARLETVERWLAEMRQGAKLASLEPFVGRHLKSAELARAHGAWTALYGR